MKLAANASKSNTAGFAGSVTQKYALVYDMRAMVNDEQRYFIIKVTPAKQAAFLRAVEKDAGLRLEDYGDILYRGWNEPEDELKEHLRQEYGLPYQKPEADVPEEQESL